MQLFQKSKYKSDLVNSSHMQCFILNDIYSCTKEFMHRRFLNYRVNHKVCVGNNIYYDLS